MMETARGTAIQFGEDMQSILRFEGAVNVDSEEVAKKYLDILVSNLQAPYREESVRCGMLTLNLLTFLHDRLKVHLREEGIRHDVIDACLAMPGNDDLTLLVHRARALSDFLKTDDGENLLQGFKRANNILTQAEEKDGVEYSYGADVKFAETDEERALFAALATAEPAIASALKAEDFARAMGAMAALRAPIDAFFTAVQVNAESQVIRRNRLNLLSSIRNICLQAADLGRIEG
jgi:glycyl-tRNA synthetase beta chain